MLKHVFLWKLLDSNDAQRAFDILNDLPGTVPTIRTWALGPHQGEPGDSGTPWDGALVIDFDSLDDLHAYETHPVHVRVVEQLTPLLADRAVVDFTPSDAS